MSKIGFIGLGIMGVPMAKNLIAAGYSLVVYDIAEDSVRKTRIGGSGARLFAGGCRREGGRGHHHHAAQLAAGGRGRAGG